MTDPAAPQRIDFTLKGARAYVRATDVLTEIVARFPGQPLVLKFARPLTGPAWLEQPARAGASVSGRAGDATFSLRQDDSAPVLRSPEARVPAFRWLRESSGLMAFWPRTPLADRLAAIFDHMRPRRSERMVVRQIRLATGLPRHAPLFRFSARIAPDQRRATVTLQTPFGRLAEIDVLVLDNPA